MVDDDNQPLPKNVPTEAEENVSDPPQSFTTWDHSGSCYHCLDGGCKNKAHINFNTDVKPTVEQLFEMFFCKPFIVGTIIPQTSKSSQEERHHPLTYGEFLHFLGLCFLMATIHGPDCIKFWSLGEVDCFIGAPMRLGCFMSRKQFEVILNSLSITGNEHPAYTDHFWEVWDILKAWNDNMVEQFRRVHENLDEQVQLPWVDVCAS